MVGSPEQAGQEECGGSLPGASVWPFQRMPGQLLSLPPPGQAPAELSLLPWAHAAGPRSSRHSEPLQGSKEAAEPSGSESHRAAGDHAHQASLPSLLWTPGWGCARVSLGATGEVAVQGPTCPLVPGTVNIKRGQLALPGNSPPPGGDLSHSTGLASVPRGAALRKHGGVTVTSQELAWGPALPMCSLQSPKSPPQGTLGTTFGRGTGGSEGPHSREVEPGWPQPEPEPEPGPESLASANP